MGIKPLSQAHKLSLIDKPASQPANKQMGPLFAAVGPFLRSKDLNTGPIVISPRQTPEEGDGRPEGPVPKGRDPQMDQG